jgi:hypothetical protein
MRNKTLTAREQMRSLRDAGLEIGSGQLAGAVLALDRIFEQHREMAFSMRQLELRLEQSYSRKTVDRAIDELKKAGVLVTDTIALCSDAEDDSFDPEELSKEAVEGSDDAYATRLVWHREAQDVDAAKDAAFRSVCATNASDFTMALGDQGEAILIRALSFLGGARDDGDRRSYEGVFGGDEKRTLDVIWTVFGHPFGFEVKNRLVQPEWSSIEPKLKMCAKMGITFILVTRTASERLERKLRAEGAGVVRAGEWLLPRSFMGFGSELSARGIPIQCSAEPTPAYRIALETELRRFGGSSARGERGGSTAPQTPSQNAIAA